MQQLAPGPAIEPLGLLLGDWRTETWRPHTPSVRAQGRIRVAWLEQGLMLIERWRVSAPALPVGLAVVCPDDTLAEYAANLGADAHVESYLLTCMYPRAPQRVYRMSFDGRIWRLWRTAPSLSERFTGVLDENHSTIEGHWERAGGKTPATRLCLTCTRRRPDQEGVIVAC